MSMADDYLEVSEGERDGWREDMEGLAEVFLRTPVPWVIQEGKETRPGGLWFSHYSRQRDSIKAQLLTISTDASFSILCLMGIEIDRQLSLKKKEGLTRLEGTRADFRTILLGRLTEKGSSEHDEAVETLHRFGLNSGQLDLLLRWISREVSFFERKTGIVPRRKPRSTLQERNPTRTR